MCVCTSDHRPATARTQRHHLWPLGLGGPEVDATLVLLCPTTHDLVHHALRGMVRDGWAPWAAGQGMTRYAHSIATLGWQSWDAAGRP